MEEKKNFYFKIRGQFNLEKDSNNWLQSARLLFLNKCCFGGGYRVNLKGEFNIGFGNKKNPAFVSCNILVKLSELFKDVIFSCKTWETACLNPKKGSFFYFDPPYVPVKKTSFIHYTKNRFDQFDFEELASVCKNLNSNHCFFSMHNAITSETIDFSNSFIIASENATNSIKGKIDQILITNFNGQSRI
jgi:DNA adenine methylase